MSTPTHGTILAKPPTANTGSAAKAYLPPAAHLPIKQHTGPHTHACVRRIGLANAAHTPANPRQKHKYNLALPTILAASLYNKNLQRPPRPAPLYPHPNRPHASIKQARGQPQTTATSNTNSKPCLAIAAAPATHHQYQPLGQ
ncbi:MAG: hypothetical protein EAY75_02995 [Bacteroidetes bacterium]|nr:MAG: hypothetical protein EAY75_02995 [Bacteroidota bacterium]